MIDSKECKDCFYHYDQMDRPPEGIAIHTRPACTKVHTESQFGKYAFIDELDICPLEIETVECKCILCDKTYNVTKKKIGRGLYIHVCDECKAAIEYVKELKIRHDDT